MREYEEDGQINGDFNNPSDLPAEKIIFIVDSSFMGAYTVRFMSGKDGNMLPSASNSSK